MATSVCVCVRVSVCAREGDAGLQFWVSPISTTLELWSLKENDKDERERETMKKRDNEEKRDGFLN